MLSVPPAPIATATPAIPVVKRKLAPNVACNCYLYVKQFVPNLPRSKFLVPNFKPREGRVALFNYDGLPHYAMIGTVTPTGFYIAHESNYKKCKISQGRFVSFNDPHYLGAWWSDDM